MTIKTALICAIHIKPGMKIWSPWLEMWFTVEKVEYEEPNVILIEDSYRMRVRYNYRLKRKI